MRKGAVAGVVYSQMIRFSCGCCCPLVGDQTWVFSLNDCEDDNPS
jgi:hypothetical protein